MSPRKSAYKKAFEMLVFISNHSLDILMIFCGHPSVISLMVIITASTRVKGGLGAAGGWWGRRKQHVDGGKDDLSTQL